FRPSHTRGKIPLADRTVFTQTSDKETVYVRFLEVDRYNYIMEQYAVYRDKDQPPVMLFMEASFVPLINDWYALRWKDEKLRYGLVQIGSNRLLVADLKSLGPRIQQLAPQHRI